LPLNKPKIAVLIDWYLPGTKAGGPVRSVYSLVNLLKNDFDFYIITSNTDLGENHPYPGVESNVIFEQEGLHYFYFSRNYANSVNVLALLEKIKPDLVYLNSFWSFPFSINIVLLKYRSRLNAPVLLAPRGMLGHGALGLKSLKKRTFILLAKLLGCYKNIYFHATQQQEQNDIESQFAHSKILVAPNVNALAAASNKSKKQENHLKLFYLSRIARVKNLHYAIALLKKMPKECRVEYDIYGNLEDKLYWEECFALAKNLPSHVKINYVRELSFDQIHEILPQYNALLLPTLNENFGHSIVESQLCGCPVIISDQTPWNDVSAHNAGYALSLSDPDKFVEAITDLCRLDEKAFLQKSNACIKYISGKINLAAVADQYKTMFHACIKN
jgi:glycosyltransferase involved in cell wall biosynthesis